MQRGSVFITLCYQNRVSVFTHPSYCGKTHATPPPYFCSAMKNVLVLILLLTTTTAFAGTRAAAVTATATATAPTAPGPKIMYVSGTVTDKFSNETLAGVEVRVKGTSIVTYTDFDGNFYLPELPAGEYTLEFHFITYATEVVVTDDTSLEQALSIALEQR